MGDAFLSVKGVAQELIKGQTIVLNPLHETEPTHVTHITVTLNWTLQDAPAGGKTADIDMDLALLLFNKDNQHRETITHRSSPSADGSISHGGDVVHCNTERDGEVCFVNLTGVSPSITTIFVVGLTQEDGLSARLKQAVASILDVTDEDDPEKVEHEVCRYRIKSSMCSPSTHSIVFGKLIRLQSDYWVFAPVGKIDDANSPPLLVGVLTRMLRDTEVDHDAVRAGNAARMDTATKQSMMDKVRSSKTSPDLPPAFLAPPPVSTLPAPTSELESLRVENAALRALVYDQANEIQRLLDRVANLTKHGSSSHSHHTEEVLAQVDELVRQRLAEQRRKNDRVMLDTVAYGTTGPLGGRSISGSHDHRRPPTGSTQRHLAPSGGSQVLGGRRSRSPEEPTADPGRRSRSPERAPQQERTLTASVSVSDLGAERKRTLVKSPSAQKLTTGPVQPERKPESIRTLTKSQSMAALTGRNEWRTR